ncbi:MAG: hypothetical protein ABI599_01645, partial [Flavobacteriales bacterium]
MGAQDMTSALSADATVVAPRAVALPRVGSDKHMRPRRRLALDALMRRVVAVLAWSAPFLLVAIAAGLAVRSAPVLAQVPLLDL